MGAVKAQLLDRSEVMREPCPACKGTGAVWYRARHATTLWPTEMTKVRTDRYETPHTCSRCGGSGYVTITPAWSGPGEEPLPF